MKKRVLSIILTAALAGTLLAGCGSSSGSSSDATDGSGDAAGVSAEAEAESESEEWTGDVSHVVMTYLTMGTTPAAMDEVEAAVNEITIPAIGVEVEFKDIALYDTFTNYSMWISSGETVDLMMIAVSDLSSYASQGMILPLDDLLAENAPYITSCVEDEGYPLYDGSYYEGEAYGVTPLMYYYGTGGSFIFEKQYLDGAGIEYDEDKVYSMDELTDIFAAIKEAYPDVYPCGQITSTQSGAGSTYYSYYGYVLEPLGATPSSGVLIDTDSTTVENLYASDEYYEFLKYMKDWYDAGYIYTDASTTSSSTNELLLAGVLAGYPMTNQPVMKSDSESILGVDCVQLQLSDSYYTAQSSSGGTFWTIPVTAAEPEAAVRFLDYTFSNHDLHNLILWGIEGEHYEVLDADNFLIGFPDGVDATTSTYYNTFGVYGDRRYEYIWDLSNSREENEAYTEEAMSNPTRAVGYAYDTTSMTTEIANVDAVIMQYVPTLESGSEKDLDSLYAEFLDALDAAGINDIIADNQAQFDAWLAEQ